MRVSKRLSAGFNRQGPDYRFDDQVDFNDIRDTFGFRTMVVGSWVNKQERLLAANLIYDALADLAQILSLPPTAIGLGVSLISLLVMAAKKAYKHIIMPIAKR